MAKRYVFTKTRSMSGKSYTTDPMTVEEAVEYYSYTLECGACYQHEKGNKKINQKPKTIQSLITNLNKASDNSARNGCGDYYSAEPAVDSHTA